MKNKVSIVVGGLVLTICLESAGLAASADEELSAAEMEEALAQLDKQQSLFDENFVKLSQDAFLVVAENIVIDKKSLVDQIERASEEQKNAGNDQAAEVLENMLYFVECSENTFAQTYQENVSQTSEDREADKTAYQALMSNLRNDLEQVRQSIAEESTGEERKSQVLNGLDFAFLKRLEQKIRLEPSGMQAKIFLKKDGGYYINVGLDAGVRPGRVYSVLNLENGDYVGNLEVIYCMPSLSVAIPSHSTEMPVGMAVAGLKTKHMPGRG